MKSIKFIFIGLLILLTSCSGYRYASMPALEFDEIDYGFQTQLQDGDVDIAYIDEGKGSTTLLLVHGLASNAGFWRYVIPELAKDYRVIAIDLPGYGKSEKGDLPFGMQWYADQIADFIQAKKLENVVYVGHSMGGQIGLTLSLSHPEVLQKMILATPAGIESFKPGEGKWLKNVLRRDDIILSSEEVVRTNLNRNFYRWDERYEWMVEERMRMAKAQEMPAFAHAVVQSVAAMVDEPTTARIPEVQTETLIVYGDSDGLIPNPFLHPGFTREVFMHAKEVMPNAELYEIKDCGHMLQIEKPMEFVKAVHSFVRN